MLQWYEWSDAINSTNYDYMLPLTNGTKMVYFIVVRISMTIRLFLFVFFAVENKIILFCILIFSIIIIIVILVGHPSGIIMITILFFIGWLLFDAMTIMGLFLFW